MSLLTAPQRRWLAVITLLAWMITPPAAAVPPGAAAAEESPETLFTARARLEEGQLTVSCSPAPRLLDKADDLPEQLREGFRAAVSFQFRLYRKRRLLSFLGDILLTETSIRRTALWDPYLRRYLIIERIEGKEERRSFADERHFITAFLSLQDRKIAASADPSPGLDEPRSATPDRRQGLGWQELGRQGPGQIYLLARLRFSPVEITRGIRLIALLSGVGELTSHWQRVSLQGRS